MNCLLLLLLLVTDFVTSSQEVYCYPTYMVRYGMGWDGISWDLLTILGMVHVMVHGHSWSWLEIQVQVLLTVSQLITIINQDRRNPSPSGTPETAETSDAGTKPPTATLSRVSLQHYCTLR